MNDSANDSNPNPGVGRRDFLNGAAATAAAASLSCADASPSKEIEEGSPAATACGFTGGSVASIRGQASYAQQKIDCIVYVLPNTVHVYIDVREMRLVGPC